MVLGKGGDETLEKHNRRILTKGREPNVLVPPRSGSLRPSERRTVKTIRGETQGGLKAKSLGKVRFLGD